MIKGIITFAISTIIFSSSAFSAVLFQEDFESYTAGTGLVGQPGSGWTQITGQNVNVDNFTPFGSKGFIGADNSPSSTSFSKITHSVGTLPSNGIVTLSFDAWGNLSSKKSHNAFVGFNDFDNPDHVYFGYINNPNTNPTKAISFGSSYGSENLFVGDSSVFDTVGELNIVLDYVNTKIYGIATFNGVTQQTSDYQVSSTFLNNLNSILLFSDYRYTNGSPYTTGANFDNIVVSSQAVPEPSTYALLLSGLLGLLYVRKRMKK